MTYRDWVALFGTSVFDPRLGARLAAAGITRRPTIPRGELFTLEEAGEGMTLGFFDESLFDGLEEAVGAGTPVLGSVLMTLIGRLRPLYAGPLPFGLERDWGRGQVVARLGPPDEADEQFAADEWAVEGLVLRVFYAEDRQAILRLRLRHPAVN